MPRNSMRWTLPAALAGLFAISLWHWWFHERAWVDDAWISFRYARSLIEGHGFSYNAEDGPVEGFTNLAWVVLTALAMKLGAAPEIFTRVLGLASHLAAVGLIASLGWRHSRAYAGTLLLAAIPGTTYGLMGLAGSGLETAFAALLIVLLAELTERFRVLPAIAVTSLLVATRPDGLLFVGVFFLSLTLRREWKSLISAGLGFLAFFAAMQTWRWFTFHSLVPNTYFAKSADQPAWSLGWEYWSAFVRSEPGVTALFTVVVLGALRMRAWATYVAVSVTLYVLYVARVGGDFMAYRFAYQVIPLVAWGAARLFVEENRTSWRAGFAAVSATCLAFAAMEPVLVVPHAFAPLDYMNGLARFGLRAGQELRERLPPQTRTATTLAGTLPYEFGGFTVDQWGLTDAFVAHLPNVPVTMRGHVKAAPESYLRTRGVNLIIGHPQICSCTSRCDEPVPQVYVRMGGDECLSTRYLVQPAELTNIFCNDARFIVNNVDCAPEPLPTWSFDERTVEVTQPTEWSPLDETLLTRHGIAFGKGWTTYALRGQARVVGFDERLLNSFHGGDASTGWLTVGPFEDARVIRGRVGGGDDCSKVFVGVRIDDVVSQRTCGRKDESLRKFSVALPAGALLVIADFGRDTWEHLLVSDLEIAR